MSNLTALLVSGTVNPFGPTLQVLFAKGEVTEFFTIYHLLLNPFKQELLEAGEGTGIGLIDEPGNYLEAECLAPFFENLGSCPTLLLDVPTFIPEAEWRTPYFETFLQGRPGARQVLKSVKQHLFNPWARVDADMASLRAGQPSVPDNSLPLSDPEAEELAKILLDQRHSEPEMRALFFAWSGSISFQQEQGNPALAAKAMTVDRFTEFLAKFETSCVFPGLKS